LDEEVTVMVVQWFEHQLWEFFAEGIHLVMHHWNACLNTHWGHFQLFLILCLEQSPNGFHLKNPHMLCIMSLNVDIQEQF
jgi:hypothetical protein